MFLGAESIPVEYAGGGLAAVLFAAVAAVFAAYRTGTKAHIEDLKAQNTLTIAMAKENTQVAANSAQAAQVVGQELRDVRNVLQEIRDEVKDLKERKP